VLRNVIAERIFGQLHDIERRGRHDLGRVEAARRPA
jgi:hypothetical protein